jgi:divalent metal cation (Fe/Co/Zn/Cd) transporter
MGFLVQKTVLSARAGMKYHIDLHTIVNGDISVKEGHAIAHTFKDELRHQLPQLGHVLFPIEPLP